MNRALSALMNALAVLLVAGCGDQAMITRDTPTPTPASVLTASDTITVAPVSRDTGAAFQTDSLTIHLAKTAMATGTGVANVYSGAVTATFTNPLPDTAFVVNCNGFSMVFLEKLVNTSWVTVWSPVIPACLSPPIVIKPGAQRATGVYVFAAAKGSRVGAMPIGTDTVPGIYRLEFQDYVSPYRDTFPFGTVLPLSQRVTNRFRILVAH